MPSLLDRAARVQARESGARRQRQAGICQRQIRRRRNHVADARQRTGGRPDAADDFAGPWTVLFITVDDLDRIETAISGAPVVKPRHDTFYGTTELYVKEPGGNLVGFAQFKKP